MIGCRRAIGSVHTRLQWVLAEGVKQGIRVLNISLASYAAPGSKVRVRVCSGLPRCQFCACGSTLVLVGAVANGLTSYRVQESNRQCPHVLCSGYCRGR
jgi:hypothetical protein